MTRLNVAAAALNQTPLDWSGNRDRILRAIEMARNTGASMLCLPELCISGYGCEDAFQSPDLQRTAREMLAEIVPATEGIIVSVGLPLMHQGALFNSTALCVDGQLAGAVAKQNLAGDGVHYEPRWFKPWPERHRKTIELAGRRVPFGDVFFDCGGVRIGFEICEDAWVANRPGGRMARRGVDVIFNPSASHFAFGKQEIRKRFVTEGSRAFGVSYLYANLLGNESGRIIFDGGTLIASDGELKASGPRFSYADIEVLYSQIDVDQTRMNRSQIASFEPDLEDAEQACVACDFDYRPAEPTTRNFSEPDWMLGPDRKFEEFTRAVTLGLFDYMRKSYTDGFVVSLSGGADSSASAVLVATLVRLAAEELGLMGVADKLDHVDGLEEATDPADMTRRLLSCAYQATRNSSATTRHAAETVAETIGANYTELDVDGLVEGYTELIEGAIGRELDWETDDIPLQNIQSRARAPSIWMLANIENKLLLATSNRSEAAVGYTTMDGDTAGGLSPIAGIDKAFLRRWLVWMRDEGPAGLAPIPELKVVTEQQPTAELRPQEAEQTDEGDLMPYPLLDAVERAAIRDKKSPVEVFELMRARFDQFDDDHLADWIEEFFKLWSRNQWKRERYAPSFHLDDENLDPKTWCRFPILSGGFERELEELRERVDGD
jgi:NAD+ synthase (glutamine-hydrolysing)